ncbi:hypothetical protein Ahy_A02g006061 isoform A [Arachis hypogaea]|uniref:Uncharacterized protein n=1 Tax=Arachis hypogaea TaxID=3818 RepID=A0A445E961_ARAHY|nr:hypothetical protein Ahy_A02g006061 isoform A [Arachis hypogaea]
MQVTTETENRSFSLTFARDISNTGFVHTFQSVLGVSLGNTVSGSVVLTVTTLVALITGMLISSSRRDPSSSAASTPTSSFAPNPTTTKLLQRLELKVVDIDVVR